jgi:hypothetical protein
MDTQRVQVSAWLCKVVLVDDRRRTRRRKARGLNWGPVYHASRMARGDVIRVLLSASRTCLVRAAPKPGRRTPRREAANPRAKGETGNGPSRARTGDFLGAMSAWAHQPRVGPFRH